ncbi:MAG: YqzL family protein [Candidatus Woesearchaeota archaeon]
MENKVSELAWKNFEMTGKISFYMLYNAIEHPENVEYRLKDNISTNKNQREISL